MTPSTSFSLARQLRAGATVYSGWCGLASPLVAEAIAREGFAAVTVDMQHGLWDITATVGSFRFQCVDSSRVRTRSTSARVKRRATTSSGPRPLIR